MALLILGVFSRSADAGDFWTKTRGVPGFSLKRNVDPSTLEVEEWHIYLYCDGESAGGGSTFWGMFIGPTMQNVVGRLRGAQQGQDALEAINRTHMRCGWRNPFGPVAVLKSHQSEPGGKNPNAERARTLLQRIQEVIDQFQKAKETYESMAGKSEEEKSAFRQQLEKLKEAIERAAKLGKELTETNTARMDELDTLETAITQTESSKVQHQHSGSESGKRDLDSKGWSNVSFTYSDNNGFECKYQQQIIVTADEITIITQSTDLYASGHVTRASGELEVKISSAAVIVGDVVTGGERAAPNVSRCLLNWTSASSSIQCKRKSIDEHGQVYTSTTGYKNPSGGWFFSLVFPNKQYADEAVLALRRTLHAQAK